MWSKTHDISGPLPSDRVTVHSDLGLMVYSHWMSLGQGQGLGSEPGRMGCMVLRRPFTLHPNRNRDLNRNREEWVI